MSLAYLFDSNIQFQDRSGNNNVNGFLRVYIDDTDDRAVTYKDFNGTLNQADIRLDNNGRAVVIVDDSKTYRLEVYGTTGVLLWTLYPISPKATGINETLEALVAAVKSHTIAIEGLALGKKNKQQAKVISGIPTKTVKSISQNADGEFTVEFEDIAFPHKVLVDGEDSVPKHLEDAIMADEQGQLKLYVDEKEDSTPESPNKVLVIDDSVLRERIDDNAQRIENLEETIDELDVDSVPRAYLASTLNQSPGDNVSTRTTIDVFSVTAIEGDCFEFEQTTTIDDTPFGYVWIEAGTYLINASVTLQWVGNPRGTFIAKVGSVMGENFDFSQEQEISRQSTKVVTIPNRMKLAMNVTYDAGTPVMGFWIQSMQVVKLAGGMSQTTVAHGLSLKGNGSVENPLDISEHGLQETFDYAKGKEYFATKQEIAPLAAKSALQAETARATQRENEIEALFTLPTQEAVDAWLEAHPEATTTVQDHSLTSDKLVIGTLNFITPEMFGAVGDGVTDDTAAINDMLASGVKNYVLSKTYKVTSTIVFSENSFVVGSGKITYVGSGLSPFIRVLSNSCVKGISVEDIGFAICGHNIVLDSCTAQGCTHSCYTIDVGEAICEHIRIVNCTARSPDSHGYLFRHRFNGSTSDNSVVDDIVFSNCTALHCGQNTSEWSCGFCFDVAGDTLTAKNIIFDNCYACDSIESGFHFEQNIVCENIVFSNCVSSSNGVRKTGGAQFGAGYVLPNSDDVRMYGCYAINNYRTPVSTPDAVRILKKADVLYSSFDNLDSFVARQNGNIVFDLEQNYTICKSLGIFNYGNFGYMESNINSGLFRSYKGNWTLEKNKLTFGDETGSSNSKGWVTLQTFRVNKHGSYTLRFKIKRTTEALQDVLMNIMLFDANGKRVAFTSTIHLARPTAIDTYMDVEYSLNNQTYTSSAGNTNWDGITKEFELASICFNGGGNHQSLSQQAVITDLYVQSSPRT